jgi:MFS family permease
MRRLILAAGLLRFLDSFVLIGPFYALMFAERGLSAAGIGVILASWSMTCVVLEVPCGVLADRMSRPLLLAIAQLVRCVGFAVWIAFPQFWGFLIGLMLWGLKSATMSGAFEAVVFDELKTIGREGDYVRVIGRTQAARISGVLGASLAGAAFAALGYDILIWLSAGAGLAASAAAFALPQAPRARPVGDWSYFRHLRQGATEAANLPGIPALVGFIAATEAVAYGVADYWQLFGHQVGLSRQGVGLFIAAIAAAGIVAASVAHRLHKLPLWVLPLLFVLGGTVIAAGAATYRAWSVVFPIAYMALFWVVDVNADARFQARLNQETRATVASVKGFVMQCATSTLMLAFGLIAEAASYRAAFLATGLVAIAVGLSFTIARLVRADADA